MAIRQQNYVVAVPRFCHGNGEGKEGKKDGKCCKISVSNMPEGIRNQ